MKKKNKKIKAKVKTTKLSDNPLFIKFLNWEQDKYSIEKHLKKLLNSFERDQDKEAVLAKLDTLDDEYLGKLSIFHKNFVKYVTEMIQIKDISEEFLMWLENAFKYIEEFVDLYAKDENRKILIKNPEGRWFEGIICYNFIMTVNYFTLQIIKRCPICLSFFAHKGKYAKYCSDSCKEKGMKK